MSCVLSRKGRKESNSVSRRCLPSRLLGSVRLPAAAVCLAMLSAAVLFAADPPASSSQKKSFKGISVRETIPSLKEEQIRKSLEMPISVDFDDTPLSEASAFIESQFPDCRILIDEKNLSDTGVSNDTPVTIEMDGVRLKSALNRILQPLDLTWVIKDDVLLITTREEAEVVTETRVYHVRGLLKTTDAKQTAAAIEELKQLLITTVKPDSWEQVGGEGSAASFSNTAALVVRQSPGVHDEIANLFEALQEE